MLHDTFAAGLDALRAERAALIEHHGRRITSEVTVSQAARGMRGVAALICDTSVVDPDRGLVIRGVPVLDLIDKLPEDVFHLLLTGALPSAAQRAALQHDLAARAAVPDAVWKVLRAMPKDAHPMAMLSAGLLALEDQSAFRRRYSEGLAREDYWRPALDDALALIAELPALAAGLYRIRYGKGKPLVYDPELDWAANFCRMLGVEDERFYRAMRIAVILQSDHEGGNVCAFACHTVGSVLSNPYLAVSAGFNGLSGPLHGLASQESILWVNGAIERYGGIPNVPHVEEYTWDTLNAGRIVPGYGHAVLRGQDPRFTGMVEYGLRYFGADEVFGTVVRMSEVVPKVLKAHGKAKNPYPNVDAVMGAVWHHFGITELPYYTVPFAVSLSLGLLAQLVINRALGSPIVRPRSVTSEWIREQAERD